MPFEANTNGRTDQEEVNRVAWRALTKLVGQEPVDPLGHRPLESYLQQLSEAVLVQDPATLSLTVKAMRRAQISSAVIAEVYVPAIARRLGEAWLADTLDFTKVTIGCTRLQRLLLDLEREWSGPATTAVDGTPHFLVGVPEGNQHTLGASVVAGQLRHRGMSVVIDLELTAARLRQLVINAQLSGVLLSVAASDGLASVQELIDISKQASRKTPVIIGGSILTVSDNIQEQIGADLVAQDVHDVLMHCLPNHKGQADTGEGTR